MRDESLDVVFNRAATSARCRKETLTLAIDGEQQSWAEMAEII